jgi:hypothetical protein
MFNVSNMTWFRCVCRSLLTLCLRNFSRVFRSLPSLLVLITRMASVMLPYACPVFNIWLEYPEWLLLLLMFRMCLLLSGIEWSACWSYYFIPVRLRFSGRWLWTMPSCGMWYCVARVRTDVSEERNASTDWKESVRQDQRKRYVRFDVFTALTMKNGVFWYIKPQFVLHRRHITFPLQSPAS